VYGKPEYLPVDEVHPTRPDNFYALTKLQADLLFEFYARNKDFHIIILRYDGIYGLGQTIPGFIQYLFESFLKNKSIVLFNNGKQKRDNVYVDDAVEANLKAMRLIRKVKFSIFNVGGGKPRTSQERAQIARRVLKSKAKIILEKKKGPFFDYDIFLDISKARKILGYRPKELEINIAEMMEEADSNAKTL
jgi:UDP-glucose 4-epimerase